MTPRAFACDFIFHWEDGGSHDTVRTHSLDPVDNGNWSGGRQGLGKLVGSNHGVTAAALAEHRGMSVTSITREAMRVLTLDEAADIALGLYYRLPRIDLLPWNRVTMSLFDMAWGAGPATAIKLMQRPLGCADDGQIGTATAKAAAQWIARIGESAAAVQYADRRLDYYDRIITARPANARYRNGWANRTRYYLPGSPWWARAA